MLSPQVDAEIARAGEPEYTKEVFPMRKRNLFLSILVVCVGLTVPRTLRAQCMPNSNITPSTYVPFTSIYYISAPDEAGDLLVVGSMSAASYSGLSGVPLPGVSNQQFCNPITLAPGIVANAYVPSVGERTGGFGNFTNILFDPSLGSGSPYPGGQIPITPTWPGVFAWRIPAKQPGPTVYVSTGYNGQILAVDGSSGVTSVLYSSESESSDLEGLTVGPDNLIYFTDPSYGYIYRIDQHGGSFATVYDSSTDQTGPVAPQGPSFSTTGLLTFNTTDDQGVWQISFGSSDNPSAPGLLISPGTGVADGQGTTYNHADELLIVESPYGDNYVNDVLQQAPAGASTTTTLISSGLSRPVGVAVNSSGNIFVSNWECDGVCEGYIAQFDSAGNPAPAYYATFPDPALYIQFDASDRLYVVTSYTEDGGKVYRVDPCGAPPCTATPLIDLNYASSNGTVPSLNGSRAVGVALSGTGTSNSYITPLQPIQPGVPVTYTYGNIASTTITIPPGSTNSNGADHIAVDFQLWNPTLFDTTRLPAGTPNTWSGGTQVLPGTTCTPIAGTGGDCIVIEFLCFASGSPVPCEISAPSGLLIGLMAMYETLSPQPYPGYIIADDGENNWANITTGYSLDTTLSGGSKGLNTDTAIVNLGQGVVSPASLEFGTVYLGTIAIKSVTVNNYGNAAMTVTDPLIWLLSGGDSKEFAAANLCPKSLLPGKSCTIVVTFLAGPNYALQTAILNVVTGGSPQSVFVSATVINPVATLSSYKLNFGKQALTATSPPAKVVKLTNTGTTPLVLSTLTVSSNFSLAGTTCGNGETLAPSAYCMIDVTFTPTTKGSQSGSVLITDNARNSPQNIILSGTAY